MGETILVTGGAGYIGSHTCKALKKAGYEPVTVDNMVYGHEWAVKWGPLIKGDILDAPFLDRVFKEHAPKAVLHFAAFAYVGESVTNPEKYYRNNVTGTLSLLEAMRRAGCGRMVFSSTCATYGVPQKLPLTEDHPQAPINPYGASKLMIERILADFAVAYGTGSVCLRYFNAAGADVDGEIGEDHDPETHLIPLIVHAAMGLRQHIEIFGTDYDTPDGTAIRDYIHVNDLAAAHIDALHYLENGGQTTCVNLGTGVGNTVRQVIQAVEKAGGKPVPLKEGPRRAGDPYALFANAELAAKLLGWTPKYSDIETIVNTAWKWHVRHHGK
jgi:UDP-arabinose 4-epimerase